MDLTFFTNTTGLNDLVDPTQLEYNEKTGVSELAVAVNCDISNTGRISRRLGQEKLASGDYQVWCKGGDGFAVNAGDLYRTVDGTVFTGLWSGFSSGRFSFEQVGGRTYFMNGSEAGYIDDGVVSSWPASDHVGSVTPRVFTDAPIGTKIAYHKNRMWVVVENEIRVSEPNAFGKFREAGCYYEFVTGLTMVKPVEGGVWISDSEKTSFITTADKWADNRMDPKQNLPAHEWSENIELIDLSKTAYQIEGLCALWSSDAGQMIGTPNGQIINGTEDKLIYPTGGSGCTVVDGTTLINSVY